MKKKELYDVTSETGGLFFHISLLPKNIFVRVAVSLGLKKVWSGRNSNKYSAGVSFPFVYCVLFFMQYIYIFFIVLFFVNCVLFLFSVFISHVFHCPLCDLLIRFFVIK